MSTPPGRDGNLGDRAGDRATVCLAPVHDRDRGPRPLCGVWKGDLREGLGE